MFNDFRKEPSQNQWPLSTSSDSSSSSSSTIHDPLFELIWKRLDLNNNTNLHFDNSVEDKSSFDFFLLDRQQNQSDLNLIPLVSSSPSFYDVTSNGQHSNQARSLSLLVVLSSILICLILATIIGNVFVISAVILERSLRSVGNYLVVSLAITDLLVACLVMPIGAIYEVTGEWRMGIKLCELWTFIDVLCCTTSIFHLLAISCDRLWAVTTVDYIHRRKTKHVWGGIAIIWLFSAIISLGPMLGWKDAEFEQRIVERKECMISQDISYQIFATIASFYAPSILLLLQYYRIYQVAKNRLKLKKQRYQYRIRRRPSFYRTRKESELKEFPRITHRVSINPNEEFFSSTVVPPPSSTSGVYSSSTNTDYTTNTNTTTNTTLSTDRTSSTISISPPAMLKSSQTPESSSGKRFSIVQFFNPQRRKSEAKLDGEKFTMTHFDDYDNNDLKSNETSIDESTIIVGGGPTSNIVVYVDDYGSTICSSCDAAEVSYYHNHQVNEDGDEEEEDEFIDSPFDDIVVDITDPGHVTTVTAAADSVIDEKMSIKQASESPEIIENIRKMSVTNESNIHFLSPPPVADIENPTSEQIPQINRSDKTDNHNHKSEHQTKNQNQHHHSSAKHKRRRIKKLKFKNKILRFDNGSNQNQESKQESKAAKTLTIITGVFIICWLPFFVLALVMPLCGSQCYINKYAFDFFIWLGWANSTLNPFLYTIFSPDFRNAFKKLLKRIRKH